MENVQIFIVAVCVLVLVAVIVNLTLVLRGSSQADAIERNAKAIAEDRTESIKQHGSVDKKLLILNDEITLLKCRLDMQLENCRKKHE